MNVWRFSIAAILLTMPLGAGCNGSSSAREPRSAVAEPTAAPAAAPRAARVEQNVAAAPASAQLGQSRAIKPDPALPKRDASGILETSFDDVKFAMDKGSVFDPSYFTEKNKALFGDRIRIRGFMYPTMRKRGLKQFVLVRDNLQCCFGPGAALFDCILVTMETGKTTEYVSNRPVAVEGEFRYEEPKGPRGEVLRAPDGRPLAIYQMTAEAVK
jgi:hypothetical protein